MKSFAGAKRRFDFRLKEADRVLIDDYAHHPDEIRASITSVRALYPDKKISVLFQPHLYSRTRDFADQFADALSLADEVYLLDIYPARELPIPGVTSDMIFEKLNVFTKKRVDKKSFLDLVNNRNFEVLITLGAGDIDQMVEPIKLAMLKW
jgi:UDP-N-acetylmuramate--alanine ligase